MQDFPYERHFVETNGIMLHVMVAGPADGPLVLLLHGFPEFWYGWRHQIQPLAEAGFRVLAPDQRGYNRSDKPPRVQDYAVDVLVRDVIGLIDWAERDTAAVVGHDWGAMVAWWTALQYPHRVERLGILNVPHPHVFQRTLSSSPRQLAKSWYAGAFQVPLMPETALRLGGKRTVSRLFQASSNPGSFTPADIDAYWEAYQRPGALTGMINWYRAYARKPPATPASWRVDKPTAIIWGRRDPFLDASMVEPSLALCTRGQLHWIDEATHWVQHDARERVSAYLLASLRGEAAADANAPEGAADA